MFSLNYENKRVVLCSSWIPLPDTSYTSSRKNSESSWGLRIFSLSHACDKTSSKLTISLISIYKHYAIDIADPSNMQDAYHMNFVIDLAHRGVSVAQW